MTITIENVKLTELQECCNCCGSCFRLDNIVDTNKISNLKFYCHDDLLVAVYVQGGRAYYIYSYDCGGEWLGPFQLYEVFGAIQSIQILTHEEQFVVATTILEKDQTILKSCSGKMGKDKKDFFVRECAGAELKGRLIDVTLCVRDKPGGSGEKETVDIKYADDNGEICLTCCGHG
jgi:hypothetical protein